MNIAISRAASLLLIEDDDVDASRLEHALRQAKIGNCLLRVHTGEEALRLLRKQAGCGVGVEPPYLILLDLALPGMSGIQFLEQLRRDPDLRDAIVLVLTVLERERDEVEARKLGVSAYIRKSRCSEDFLDVLGSIQASWSLVADLQGV